jgi:hypothetical protein
VGFEPTNGGFADLSLGPLGYRAGLFSIAKTPRSVRAPSEAKLLLLVFCKRTHGKHARHKDIPDVISCRTEFL